jgi:hypothetical protein
MMASRQTTLPLLLVCLLLTGSCKQFAKTMGELMVVRHEIIKKFGDEANINVSEFQNQITFSVTFINSSLNDRSSAEREKRAQETVEIVKTHYPKIQIVSSILISFSRQQTRLFVIHTFETVDLFVFDRNGKPLEYGNPTTSGVITPRIELETKATYLENANQSDVAVSGIQLEGEPGSGITLLPHFTVAGDVTKSKAPPPTFVTFDFASYSAEERFKEDITFRFLVDGKSAVKTTGKFSTMKPPDATGQFCYLGFPYKAFQRMVSGESLTIQIGEMSYDLTSEQLDAMKKMTQFVK